MLSDHAKLLAGGNKADSSKTASQGSKKAKAMQASAQGSMPGPTQPQAVSEPQYLSLDPSIPLGPLSQALPVSFLSHLPTLFDIKSYLH